MFRHIESYVHGGRIGVLVELETADDFTVRTDEFARLARDLAVHIAAMDPIGISQANLDRFLRAWPHAEPVDEDTLLMSQRFVRDDDQTVAERIKEAEARLGTRITVRRFVRWANDE